MPGIVRTEKNKCKQCYSCVRHCPVKAVRVKNGQAEVLSERCIACGNCVKVCSQNAKTIESGIDKTLEILHRKEFKIAILAPSFPAAFTKDICGRIIAALKMMGFDEVWEVAVGAELIGEKYEELLNNRFKPPLISSACPAVVNLIEKHFPSLIPHLSPVVSPMIATGRLIKLEYPEALVVFIGPCVAKKDEMKQVEGVDAVLTFKELEDMIFTKNIDITRLEPSCFDGPLPQKAFRGFPVSGGLFLSLKDPFNFSRKTVIVDKREDVLPCLESIDSGEYNPYFVDILMCGGCVEGPHFKDTNYFANREKVEEFLLQGDKNDKDRDTVSEYLMHMKNAQELDLTRRYSSKAVFLKSPSEEDIRKILNYTNKYSLQDELNCGACGYSSCREKAVAVYNGIAEIDMCLPFLLTKEIKEKKRTEEFNREMNAIIDSSYDGIFVSDGEGKTLRLNRAFARFLGKSPESVIGLKADDLEKSRIIYPSLTKLVLKEKRRLTLIQETGTGKKVLATGNPIFDEEGRVVRVVVNARDMAELNHLSREALDFEKLKTYMEQSSLELNQGPLPRIVSISPLMEELLRIALRVAAVNSTVLILGESGVGKGLIARFIHENSPRKKGPFIKVNCGSIPESLLESELFGYETGAFTGARREGKPGLIEMAHKGTLLLDEIGDLPLNLQVKLLQVLQEKELTRIGGTKPIEVDIRVIAATNKDLRKMAEEGTFREDLYYRLNVVPLVVPPLRDRKEDVEPLIDYFMAYFNKNYGMTKSITEDAMKALVNYSWPGNVRELENLIERLVVTSERNCITIQELPEFIRGKKPPLQKITVEGIMPLKKAQDLVEQQLLELAVKQCNTTYEMAELLGVNQSTIVRKLQRFKDKQI
ncbi:MAG: hypothetical protein PWR06_37 [Thermoanaerobacteraceae bacterium]|uniref:PAS domain-containing protein n=1 Tax=Biomaibacter acetigenes TaxID=2316383 RepID=A0A3G2R6E4_9FIRM|nr:sigma 54-interacting transcriptional regulator [Biomaibacter acetigenes]AYO31030.1 PAS domain-containing protein [Biomaibacter acetigenes]MDK2877321.1 hypothetical protein [Thermoanaerobacteraceae bacterium]MDN5312513.1 hypothetical protein [Thermoanaerobacteraceae bacterium]